MNGRDPPSAPPPVVDEQGDDTTVIPRRLTTIPPASPVVSYSDVDQLRHKDFAACTPEELEEISRLLERTASVRTCSVPDECGDSQRHHGRHDARATVRRALRSGGEIARSVAPGASVTPSPSGPLVRRQRVHGALLPGSLALPPRGRGSAKDRVEAFAVGTRLTRLTRQLSSRDPDAALAQAPSGSSTGRVVPGWVRESAPSTIVLGSRGMARGAIVVILSDGWDRGDPDRLAGGDGPPPSGRLIRRSGSTRSRHPTGMSPWPGGWRLRCPTSTSSSRATRPPRSMRW